MANNLLEGTVVLVDRMKMVLVRNFVGSDQLVDTTGSVHQIESLKRAGMKYELDLNQSSFLFKIAAPYWAQFKGDSYASSIFICPVIGEFFYHLHDW